MSNRGSLKFVPEMIAFNNDNEGTRERFVVDAHVGNKQGYKLWGKWSFTKGSNRVNWHPLTISDLRGYTMRKKSVSSFLAYEMKCIDVRSPSSTNCSTIATSRQIRSKSKNPTESNKIALAKWACWRTFVKSYMHQYEGIETNQQLWSLVFAGSPKFIEARSESEQSIFRTVWEQGNLRERTMLVRHYRVVGSMKKAMRRCWRGANRRYLNEVVRGKRTLNLRLIRQRAYIHPNAERTVRMDRYSSNVIATAVRWGKYTEAYFNWRNALDNLVAVREYAENETELAAIVRAINIGRNITPKRPAVEEYNAMWRWLNPIRQRRWRQAAHNPEEISAENERNEERRNEVAASLNTEGFKVLITSEDYMQEGITMHHCVASYYRSTQLIAHVEVGNEKVTVAWSEHFDGFAINQVYGPCNAPASPRVRQLVNSKLEEFYGK